jgi:hypothetical protein
LGAFPIQGVDFHCAGSPDFAVRCFLRPRHSGVKKRQTEFELFARAAKLSN